MIAELDENLMAECRRDALNWTRELIRRNSENPPGYEIECANFCADILRALGMDVTVDEFLPGRANVVAFLGNREHIGMAFNGHLDVVAAKDGWQAPPFEARVQDGRIWGRGSADMKSGCAAIMAAAKYLIRSDWNFSKKGLALTFVADEEKVNLGSKRLAKTYRLRADGCIIAEPTQLQVHYGNRGYTSYYIRTHGQSCHACRPKNGVNAIYKIARVVGKLERFADELANRTDEQLGAVSLSVGTIRGGTSLNTVPDFCEIEVESRVLPGMDADGMSKELAKLLGTEAQVVVRSDLPASLVPADSLIVRRAGSCVKRATGADAVIAEFPACSEASFFSVGFEMPTILLGPGDIGRAHRANEFVPILQIEQAVEIYVYMIQSYTG